MYKHLIELVSLKYETKRQKGPAHYLCNIYHLFINNVSVYMTIRIFFKNEVLVLYEKIPDEGHVDRNVVNT